MLPGGDEIRAAAVVFAWDEYLETCREGLEAGEYQAVESWAWARLQQQLEQAAPAT